MERKIKVIIGISVVVVLAAIGIGGFTSMVSSYEYPLPLNVTGYDIEYDEKEDEFKVTVAMMVKNPYNFSVKDILIKSKITATYEYGFQFEYPMTFTHFPREVGSGEMAPLNYSTKVDFAPENINIYVYARK